MRVAGLIPVMLTRYCAMQEVAFSGRGLLSCDLLQGVKYITAIIEKDAHHMVKRLKRNREMMLVKRVMSQAGP